MLPRFFRAALHATAALVAAAGPALAPVVARAGGPTQVTLGADRTGSNPLLCVVSGTPAACAAVLGTWTGGTFALQRSGSAMKARAKNGEGVPTTQSDAAWFTQNAAAAAAAQTTAAAAMPTIRGFSGVVCAGDDTHDDAPGLNAALVAMKGKGMIDMPPGTDCRVRTPVVMQPGTGFFGRGAAYAEAGGNNSAAAAIRPSASMTDVVTQADLTTPLNGVGIVGVQVDGRAPGTTSNAPLSLTVSHLVHLSLINSHIINDVIENSSGDGVYLSKTSTVAWINLVQGNNIVSNAGWGLHSENTDSIFAENYISSNGSKSLRTGGNLWVQGPGGNKVVSNQIEVSPVGILDESDDTAIAIPQIGNLYVGNYLDRNSTSIHIAHGAFALAGQVQVNSLFSGNLLKNANLQDYLIDDYMIGGQISDTIFGTSPSAGNVTFLGSHAIGWSISGRFFGPPSTWVSTPPGDLQIFGTGLQGFANKMPGLTVGPDGTGSMNAALNINAAGAAGVPSYNWQFAGTTKWTVLMDPGTGQLRTMYAPSGTLVEALSTTVRSEAIAQANTAMAITASHSGFTLTLNNYQDTAIIDGGGTLASGTLILPSAPVDGQEASLVCGVAVTSLTLQSTKPVKNGSATSCTSAAGHAWKYNAYFGNWYQRY